MRGRKRKPKVPLLGDNTRYSTVSEICERLIAVVLDGAEECFQYRLKLLNELVDTWLKENIDRNEVENNVSCEEVVDSKSFQEKVLGSGSVVDETNFLSKHHDDVHDEANHLGKHDDDVDGTSFLSKPDYDEDVVANDSNTDIDESYQYLNTPDIKPLVTCCDEHLVSTQAEKVEIKQEQVELPASKPVTKLKTRRKKPATKKKKKPLDHSDTSDNDESVIGGGQTVVPGLDRKSTRGRPRSKRKNVTNVREKIKKKREIVKGELDAPGVFCCEHCGDLLPTQRALLVHSERHVGPASKPCQYCGKVFTRHPYLKRHMACVHGHEGRKIPCSICDKTFTRTDHLQLHMRFHTDERPYICTLCGKGFHNGPHLKKHLHMHTGHKPYTCDVCDKGYVNRESLHHHRLSRHGLNPSSQPLSIYSKMQTLPLPSSLP